jgi:hypothetical protein
MSHSDLSHVLALKHLLQNKNQYTEMSGAAFILEVSNSVDAMAFEDRFSVSTAYVKWHMCVR